MATLVDPWGGYNQGMQNLGNTFTDIANQKRQANMDAITLRRLALDEKVKEAGLADQSAQQGAMLQAYNAPDLQSAYAAKIKTEQQMKRHADFFDHIDKLKKAGASPQFITTWAKSILSKEPDTAAMAPDISFIDDKAIKIVKDFGDNQLPDPLQPGKFLPAGKYEVEGQATGDPMNPYKFTTVKPVEMKPQKPVDVVTQEASTFLTGKGYDLTTPEKQAVAFKWFATPEGQKEWLKYVDRVSASRYNPPPPTNIVLGANPETGNIIVGSSKGNVNPREIETGPLATKNLANPSAGEREKTAAFETLKSQVQRIKEGFKPSYVGVASGPLGAITQYTDADEAAYRQVIADVKDSLLRARSGAQINEQEYARLSKLVPSVNDSETKFKGKMKSFEKTLDTLITEREKAQMRGGVGFRGKKQPTAYVYDPKTGTLKPK